jgi:hypothetical protein
MSTQAEQSGGAGGEGAGAEPGAAGGPRDEAGFGQAENPSEAQARAAYEAELSRITSVDMVLQAAASLLNIGAHRLGLTGGGGAGIDLEQVRDAIDAVRGLLPVIERRAPEELRPLRDALAQLQMAYSRAVQAAPTAPAPETQAAPEGHSPPEGRDPAAASAPAAAAAPGASPPQPAGADKPGPGPAESSGRLWVPGR